MHVYTGRGYKQSLRWLNSIGHAERERERERERGREREREEGEGGRERGT